MGKTILILGGGAGGLVAANKLRKKLNDEHKIVLIDQNDFQLYYPSLFWILEGTRTSEQISKKLNGISKKGIEFHQEKITKIDVITKQVEAGENIHSYDYLIIALGAKLNYEAVPGIGPKNCLYVLPGILNLREQLKTFSGGKVYLVVSSVPFRCPAAPYEAALLLDDYFRQRGIRDKVDLRLFTAEAQPMPVAGPKIGTLVRKIIEGQGVKYHPTVKLASVDNQNRKIFFDNGDNFDFDLLAIVPPHNAPEAVRDAGLLGDNGWVLVNPAIMETKYPEVFAIGDITGIKLPSGKPLPKAGVFAHFEAEVVAERIAAEIEGKKPVAKFTGWGSCFLEIGGGKAGLAFGNFYANPDPKVIMLPPMKLWHWVKIIFEKWWFWKWF
ncbi:NAD(P)/FAD-dependent oxidoreductase [Candidatus Saganbacteria bacterium]|nr:NAD(P)/FAD-dependent oxidoreductase [Candidatus Saganbacteria bacterium]